MHLPNSIAFKTDIMNEIQQKLSKRLAISARLGRYAVTIPISKYFS